jgi:hypothetical protein
VIFERWVARRRAHAGPAAEREPVGAATR